MEIDRRTCLRGLAGVGLGLLGFCEVKVGQSLASSQDKKLGFLAGISDKRRADFAFFNQTMHHLFKVEDDFSFWELVDELANFRKDVFPYRLKVDSSTPFKVSSRDMVDNQLIYTFQFDGERPLPNPDIKIIRSFSNRKPFSTLVDIYYGQNGFILPSPAVVKAKYSAQEFNQMVTNVQNTVAGLSEKLLQLPPLKWNPNYSSAKTFVTQEDWLTSSTSTVEDSTVSYMIYPLQRLQVANYYQVGPNPLS